MDNIHIKSGNTYVNANLYGGSQEKLAVLMPGFLDTKDYLDLQSLSEMFVENDFAVVCFDPVGTWGSGGDITDYSVTEYLKNVRSVIDYMEQKKGSRFEKIVIGGKSLGGLVSTLYAAQDIRISSIVSIVAPINPGLLKSEKWKQEGVRHSTRDIPDIPDENREFNVPWAFYEDVEQYDVLNSIKTLQVPILFIGGELDKSVTPEIIETAYSNATDPKRMTIVPEATHTYRANDKHVKLVNEAVKKFVNEYVC